MKGASPLTDPVAERRLFARAARTGFEVARHATGRASEVSFRLADRVLRLRFAGDALMTSLTEGLALERVSADVPANLEIGIWDQETSGVGPPVCPFGEGDFVVRGDVRHPWGGEVHLSYAVASGAIEYCDLAEGAGCFWIRRARALETWRRAAPLRDLCAALAAEAGGCLAHAAAIGYAGVGLLLPGPSGSGKSTTALSAAARGFSFCGDDFVLLRPDARGAVRVESLYATAKLTTAGCRAAGLAPERFPRLEPGGDDDGEKTVLRVPACPGLDLRAIVVPVGAGQVQRRGRAQLRPASRVEVLRALLPSSLLLVAGAAERMRPRLAALAARLPGYVLELGEDPEDNVAALASVLADARSGPRAIA
jgi:hypothetical protein